MNIPRSPLQWPAGWPRTTNPKPSRFGTWNSKPTISAAGEYLAQELKRLSQDNLNGANFGMEWLAQQCIESLR